MSSVSPSSRTRKPKSKAPKPADTFRIIFEIRGEQYVVTPMKPDEGSGATHLIRFRKFGGATHYVAQTMHGPTCSCGDFCFRHDGIDNLGCKHIRTARRAKMLPPRPAKVDEWEATGADNWTWNLGPDPGHTADAEPADRRAAWAAEAEAFARDSLAAAVEAGIADAD